MLYCMLETCMYVANVEMSDWSAVFVVKTSRTRTCIEMLNKTYTIKLWLLVISISLITYIIRGLPLLDADRILQGDSN